jgi:hypothetical protein
MNKCFFCDETSLCFNPSAPGEMYDHKCLEFDGVLCDYRQEALPEVMCANKYSRNTKEECDKCHYSPLRQCFEPVKLSRDSDSVNHPPHYCQGGIECIKAIEASMTPGEFQGYCKGNVIKYCWRFREKNGVEDLKKASVYLNWMIESLEKMENN